MIQTAIKGAAAAAPDLMIPLAKHISAEGFERERPAVFGKSWLLAGHAADLPQPGDYQVREFAVPRASLLLVRGDDVIEVFPNRVMLMGQHYLNEIEFLPVGASCTVVINETFGYRPANLAERASQELVRSREREVVREDLSLLETQHAAPATGEMEHVVLSRQEMALAHHFKARQQMLEAAA
ncbi:MAG: hypothetical protein JNL30_14360 [Rubrivivax sp.]|nr:hypothetical protein [Rubrivivax sp.]